MILELLAAGPVGAEIPSAENQLFSTILMFGTIFVIFYFLIIRPQQKKFKEHHALVSSIEKNDKVITAGGVLGTVTKAAKDDGLLTIEISEGVKIQVLADTISTVLDDKAKVANDNAKEEKKSKKNKMGKQ